MSNVTQRIGALIGGSINSFVSQLEQNNPEIVMNNSIKEIEGLISEARAELGKKMVERTRLKKSFDGEQSRHNELGEQIALAVKAQKDNLAETGINKQIEIESQLTVIDMNLQAVTSEVGELENMVRALQSRRAEYVEQVKIYAESAAANVANDLLSKAENVESTFQRIQNKATTLTLGVDDPDTVDELEQLQQLSQNNAVQQRLAAYKAQAAQPTE